MSRTLRKAVESTKQKRETELRLPDEGIANLEDVPELCELHIAYVGIQLPGRPSLKLLKDNCLK